MRRGDKKGEYKNTAYSNDFYFENAHCQNHYGFNYIKFLCL